jgi:hypothetical protein
MRRAWAISQYPLPCGLEEEKKKKGRINQQKKLAKL